jgi:transcriptional regulator with XRE-family HTH domain
MTFSGRFCEDTLTAEARERLARGQRQAAFMQAVKQPLYQEMSAQGLTVTKLAERLGVTKGAVSRALNSDNNIEAFTLFAMAEALGCVWQVSLRRRDNTSDEDECPLGS